MANNRPLHITDFSSVDFDCSSGKMRIQFPSDSLVDNGDGTYTHTSVDGSVQVIDTNQTVSVANNGDGTYDITDDSGNVTTIAPATSVFTDINGDVGYGTINSATHDDGNGNIVTETEIVTGFEDDPNDPYQQIYRSEDGTEYCVPKCVEYFAAPVNDVYTITNCDWQKICPKDNDLNICLGLNGTPDQHIYKVKHGDKDEGTLFEVVTGNDGCFLIKPIGCPDTPFMNGNFDYCIECPDGSQWDAEVVINYTPPPVGEIRLEKEFIDANGDPANQVETGDIVFIKLTVSNVGDVGSSISNIQVTDFLNPNLTFVGSDAPLPETVSVVGSNVVWDLVGITLGDPGSGTETEVTLVEVEVTGTGFMDIPNTAQAVGIDNNGDTTSDWAVDSLSPLPEPPTTELVASDPNSDGEFNIDQIYKKSDGTAVPNGERISLTFTNANGFEEVLCCTTGDTAANCTQVSIVNSTNSVLPNLTGTISDGSTLIFDKKSWAGGISPNAATCTAVPSNPANSGTNAADLDIIAHIADPLCGPNPGVCVESTDTGTTICRIEFSAFDNNNLDVNVIASDPNGITTLSLLGPETNCAFINGYNNGAIVEGTTQALDFSITGCGCGVRPDAGTATEWYISEAIFSDGTVFTNNDSSLYNLPSTTNMTSWYGGNTLNGPLVDMITDANCGVLIDARSWSNVFVTDEVSRLAQTVGFGFCGCHLTEMTIRHVGGNTDPNGDPWYIKFQAVHVDALDY